MAEIPEYHRLVRLSVRCDPLDIGRRVTHAEGIYVAGLVNIDILDLTAYGVVRRSVCIRKMILLC